METKRVTQFLLGASVSICVLLSVVAYSDNTGSGAPAGLIEFTSETLLAQKSEEAQLVVDINHCGKDELMLLPRVGEVIAQRILDDRAANGPYSSAEDLLRVKGIGDATLEQIRPHIEIK